MVLDRSEQVCHLLHAWYIMVGILKERSTGDSLALTNKTNKTFPHYCGLTWAPPPGLISTEKCAGDFPEHRIPTFACVRISLSIAATGDLRRKTRRSFMISAINCTNLLATGGGLQNLHRLTNCGRHYDAVLQENSENEIKCNENKQHTAAASNTTGSKTKLDQRCQIVFMLFDLHKKYQYSRLSTKYHLKYQYS